MASQGPAAQRDPWPPSSVTHPSPCWLSGVPSQSRSSGETQSRGAGPTARGQDGPASPQATVPNTHIPRSPWATVQPGAAHGPPPTQGGALLDGAAEEDSPATLVAVEVGAREVADVEWRTAEEEECGVSEVADADVDGGDAAADVDGTSAPLELAGTRAAGMGQWVDNKTVEMVVVRPLWMESSRALVVRAS